MKQIDQAEIDKMTHEVHVKYLNGKIAELNYKLFLAENLRDIIRAKVSRMELAAFKAGFKAGSDVDRKKTYKPSYKKWIEPQNPELFWNMNKHQRKKMNEDYQLRHYGSYGKW